MRTLLILTFVLVGCNAIAQDTIYPLGCYLNLHEFKALNPSQKCNLSIKIKSEYITSGNDYILYSEDKTVSKDFIKDELWAYADSTGLYINGTRLHSQKNYVKALSKGRFLAVYCSDIVSVAYNLQASDKFLYVLDIKKERLYRADWKYMEEMLMEFPSLLSEFKSERDRKSDVVIFSYIKKANQNQ